MKSIFLGLIAIAGLVLWSGCTKKPPPPPPIVQAPVEPEEADTPPPAPSGDDAALRRQAIQGRITATFKTIYFDYDQSALSTEGKATCDAIGQLMKDVPEITARVEGNADDRGTNEYNLALGDHRAKAIQAYLVSYGITAARLPVISYGEEKPAIDGHEESAWSKNRRVDFTPNFQ